MRGHESASSLRSHALERAEAENLEAGAEDGGGRLAKHYALRVDAYDLT